MDKAKVLAKYLPEPAAPLVARWIDHFHCDFRISRNRSSKFGDFRPPHQGINARISVNFDLNPYAFLVTTVHEFAHLVTWQQYQRSVKPHGQEWKENFKKMMQPFFKLKIFPPDLNLAIAAYLENPAASSCSDVTLFKALRRYDQSTPFKTVESLPADATFSLKDGRIFRKGKLLRKRFSCVEIRTGRIYLFSPIAEVFPVS